MSLIDSKSRFILLLFRMHEEVGFAVEHGHLPRLTQDRLRRMSKKPVHQNSLVCGVAGPGDLYSCIVSTVNWEQVVCEHRSAGSARYRHVRRGLSKPFRESSAYHSIWRFRDLETVDRDRRLSASAANPELAQRVIAAISL